MDLDELRARKIDELKDMVAANTGVPKSILEKCLEEGINYDKKIPINYIPNDTVRMPENIEFYLSDYRQKMLTCTEMEDEFIFEHLVKYTKDELYTPEDNIRIPKQLLIRALICFKAEHKEEWDTLMSVKENK